MCFDLYQGGVSSLEGSVVESANQRVKPLAGGGLVFGGLEVDSLAVCKLPECAEQVCEYS